MPQLQNIVLRDRAATPVNHTFTPLDIQSGVGTTTESTGVPVGDPSFTVSLRKTPSGGYKALIKGRFPIVQTQTINGVSTPVIVRTAYSEFSFSFDATSSEAERNDVVGMMQSSLDANKPLTNDLIVKLQGVY
jgi:hypothetical protein